MTTALTVRTRVTLAVGAMLLPLLGLGGASVWFLESTVDAFGAAVEEASEEALPLARADALVLEVEVALVPALADPLAYGGAYTTSRDALRAALDDLAAEDMTEEAGALGASRAAAEEAFRRTDAALADGPAADRSTAAAQAVPLRHRLEEARVGLHEAAQVAAEDLAGEYDEARGAHRQALAAVLAALALGATLAVAAGALLARSILPPLALLRDGAARLGSGNLSHRLGLARADEFGEVARAFDDMAAALGSSREELAHTSLHDALTGLPNRVLFADRADQALARRRRHGRHVAVLLIDLDGFKAVNDTFGHDAGDEVLRAAADRLRLSVRPEDTAARLGGDEFAVLVESDSPEQARAVAERVLHAMRPAFSHLGQELYLSASIGLAGTVVGRDSTGPDLLRDADLAMYSAKQGGKDAVGEYDPRMHDDAQERLRLDADLRRALDRGEFVLHYQPIVGIGGEPLVAVEALLRWQHPELGLVAPDRFIPVAEAGGMMTTIGSWVLDEACRQLREWQDAGELGGWGVTAAGLQMSVNLSPRQLADDGLPGLVADVLARHGIDPERLILEITESMMVTDVPRTVARLQQLKALGVQLAVDDFGTGYSSLSYLQQFPIDRIKIDKSFVDQLGTAEGRALAQGIINLARSLTLEPIAEGIEQPRQRATLDELGCRLGQGYHFARPETADHIQVRLAGAGRLPAAALPACG